MELNRRTVIAGAAAAGLAATTLGGTAQAAQGRKPVKELFGTLADGTKVYRWSLENGGTRLKVPPTAASSRPWRSPTGTAGTPTWSPVSTTSPTTPRRARTSAP
ncbi:hypothetical protein LT493_09245 [Streptomyces tricolor]|nr:hypothetical protein [Streptomyces tricolor]